MLLEMRALFRAQGFAEEEEEFSSIDWEDALHTPRLRMVTGRFSIQWTFRPTQWSVGQQCAVFIVGKSKVGITRDQPLESEATRASPRAISDLGIA